MPSTIRTTLLIFCSKKDYLHFGCGTTVHSYLHTKRAPVPKTESWPTMASSQIVGVFCPQCRTRSELAVPFAVGAIAQISCPSCSSPHSVRSPRPMLEEVSAHTHKSLSPNLWVSMLGSRILDSHILARSRRPLHVRVATAPGASPHKLSRTSRTLRRTSSPNLVVMADSSQSTPCLQQTRWWQQW